jgi:SAM-dependent methyltransferase
MTESILIKVSRATRLRRYCGRPFLQVSEWAWNRMPSLLRETYPISVYGAFLHSLVKLRSARTQYHGTFFFRNLPQLQLISTLASQKPLNSPLKILVLACSNGAEVYSLLWTIRSARPDLRLMVSAVDISPAILEIAKEAVYSLGENKLVQSPIFERLTEGELQMMFDKENDNVKVKAWIRESVDWHVGDANDQELVKHFGKYDFVVSNNFLCHMPPKEAERCLRKISHLVVENGHLVVSGVDIDIRTKVALELGWIPMKASLEEIHNGDPVIRRDWPWKYWGLEPFNKRRKDWSLRYASVFRCARNLTDGSQSLRPAQSNSLSEQTVVKSL